MAAVWIAYACFPGIGMAAGIGVPGKLFLDLEGLLASGEAAQRGLDPFLPNPLDVYRRAHIYAEWWLLTGQIGLVRADTFWLGALLTSATLASAIFFLRLRRWRQALITVLVLVSPALLLALDRANNDLVIFILMGGALVLLDRTHMLARVLGVGLLATAAVLKYYPLVAAIVLLDARTRREWLGSCLIFCVVLAVAWPSLGLRAALKYPARPEWLYAFGAPIIFRNLGLVVPWGWLALGFGLLATLAGASARRELKKPDPGFLPTPEERAFTCGAVLVIGCFLTGSSYAYKLVFCLWMLPWLWRSPPAFSSDRWRWVTLGLLLGVLWLEGLLATALNVAGLALPHRLAMRILEVGLATNQVLTWALITYLLRGVFVYVGRRLPRIIRGDWVKA